MTLMDDINTKVTEIDALKRDRPGTKQEYLSALETAEHELSELVEQKRLADAAEDEQARIELENTTEYKISRIDEEYTPQFKALQEAYMAALILGDSDTMTSNRTTYQTLLEEYNTKLEAIS